MNRLLKPIFKSIIDQITGRNSSERSGDIFITRHAYLKMREFGIEEIKIRETFAKGSQVKKNMIIRQYNGYFIGLTFAYDEEIKVHTIITCWRSKSW